jgi:ABC-2 type transport system ATP-binding protein
MNEAVNVEGVHFAFPGGTTALAEVTAIIRPGRITGLVGPDGAGKTTLLRLLAGLLLPDAGRIRVLGLDTRAEGRGLPELLGYMPQKFGLYEDLSVRQNLRLYADLRGVTGSERDAAFRRLLSFSGLEPFQQRLAGRLSGGMKQKLGLACALIRKPRLLLLDEPSVGVDPVSRRELWRMVQELVDDSLAVVWSTAYLDEAERCAEVLLLNEGRLLHAGPPGDLTRPLQGRCLLLRDLTGNRRQILMETLGRPEIQDGQVQGRDLRLVLRPDAAAPAVADLNAGPAARLEEVPPRFEDAFVDLLGGGPPSVSALAEGQTVLSAAAEAMVEADRLTRRFGDFVAAREVSFSIRPGEIFGLLGPNGAGKSTTFKMLCGLLRPTSGSSRVAGYDLQRAPGQARSRLGYMAQKFSLYGDLSAKQNLAFFSGVYGLKGGRRRQAIADMIDTFHLGPYLRSSARELPLGYKQRLALACAMLHRPPVLFLDEPTSGVDPLTRREFWTHINGLVEKGVTVLVTTHFMDEAEHCDRIALMHQGRVMATDTPDGLKERVRSPHLPVPTLEEAFIELLERWRQDREEADG